MRVGPGAVRLVRLLRRFRPRYIIIIRLGEAPVGLRPIRREEEGEEEGTRGLMLGGIEYKEDKERIQQKEQGEI